MIIKKYIPKKIHIETVVGCNARCIMCPNYGDNVHILKMSMELFKKIINDIIVIDPQPSIKLSLNGEPLLDEEIVEKIKYIKKIKNIRISMNTNASLLNNINSTAIILSGIDRINFHISGFSSEIYNNVMSGLNFNSTMKNVLNFIDQAKNLRSDIVIATKFVVLKENIKELKVAENYWLSKGVLFRPDILDGRLGSARQYDELDISGNINRENLICPLIFDQMFIRYNGDVVSCWSDWYSERKFGNCNFLSVLDVYNSNQFNELRRLHINKNKKASTLCSKCSWVDKEKYDI